MAAQDIGVVYVHVEPSGKGFGKSIEGDIGDAVSKASRKGSNTLVAKIGGAFGKIGKVGTGAIATIAGGITALAAKGGFTRALNIENAQAKLKGLGHDSASVTEIDERRPRIRQGHRVRTGRRRDRGGQPVRLRRQGGRRAHPGAQDRRRHRADQRQEPDRHRHDLRIGRRPRKTPGRRHAPAHVERHPRPPDARQAPEQDQRRSFRHGLGRQDRLPDLRRRHEGGPRRRRPERRHHVHRRAGQREGRVEPTRRNRGHARPQRPARPVQPGHTAHRRVHRRRETDAGESRRGIAEGIGTGHPHGHRLLRQARQKPDRPAVRLLSRFPQGRSEGTRLIPVGSCRSRLERHLRTALRTLQSGERTIARNR